MTDGVVAVFGSAARDFGLDRGLPEEAQTLAEAEQMAAHCGALPSEMLPSFVEVQRLREATLARMALVALRETGGPVVVITGNGHARRDGGAPAYVTLAAPETRIFSLGQSEDGVITGVFDLVQDADPAERPDPCGAFRKS